MADEFEDETGAELELVINEEYTECIEALREKAGQTEKDYGELGFRILQILEHL
jgi:ABC-type phosphate/phosphonate transport system substrate-binding protein